MQSMFQTRDMKETYVVWNQALVNEVKYNYKLTGSSVRMARAG